MIIYLGYNIRRNEVECEKKNSRTKKPFHEISIVFLQGIFNIKYMFNVILNGTSANEALKIRLKKQTKNLQKNLKVN